MPGVGVPCVPGAGGQTFEFKFNITTVVHTIVPWFTECKAHKLSGSGTKVGVIYTLSGSEKHALDRLLSLLC